MSIADILAEAEADNKNNGENGDTNHCPGLGANRRGSGMTDVTIRGINDEVYASFAAEAKKRGVPIGELTTNVMRDFVEGSSGKTVYRINDVAQLVISKNDLRSIDGVVSLSDIDMLEFSDDVDWDTFRTKVEKIEDVRLVVVPETLSKFQVLTKAHDVQMVKSKK